MFDQTTIDKIGFYVYALINPKDNKPFYVGKGSGNRVFAHKDFGSEVERVIIRHGLTEEEALEIEASIIDFADKLGFKLENSQSGHNSSEKGLMTTEEIIHAYAEPLDESEITDIVITININQKYNQDDSPEKIYEAVKESWVIGEKRNTRKYVFAEYKGVILEVFEIQEWYEVKKHNRWGFNGIVANDDIREKYIGKRLPKGRQQNPIRYYN